ncbi:MAG TPA: hypothetical protein DCX54_12320 [Flavobacteriales bacterium]|nr:hypothetical protein [Flavobacteriales bacterium]
MNTHGHRHVAESTGKKRLEDAFVELGIQNVNLNAFYLGNWLTDMSQVNDPVAGCFGELTSKIGQKLKDNAFLLLCKYRSFFINELAITFPEILNKKGESDSPLIRHLLFQTSSYLTELSVKFTTLAALLRKPPQKGQNGESTGNTFGDALLSMVRFVAYSKFAHPDPQSGNPGIPYEIFDKIFKSICVQYYPHEHLDRPECKYSYGSICEDGWGPLKSRYPNKLYSNRIGKKDRTSPNSSGQSIYDYLQDDIRIAASLLCEVDKEWASRFFRSCADLQNDENFHLGLAKLGHALHAVEDFFAHSNFIEHAALLNGDQYIKDNFYDVDLVQRAYKGKPESGDLLKAVKSDKAVVKVLKRLKRFSPGVSNDEWNLIADEPAVVTGYFDCQDTLISLFHVLEELLGIKEEKNITFNEILSQYGKNYAEEILDEFEIEDISKIIQDKTIEAKARRSLLELLDYFSDQAKVKRVSGGISSQEIQERIKEKGYFPEYPQEILFDVIKIVVILCSDQIEKMELTFNIFQLIKTVVEFAENPFSFLLKPLRSPLFNGKFAVKIIIELLLRNTFQKAIYDLKEHLFEIIGAYRIGSHSLLAKDYETEPLYKQMFNCARTIHWYIIDTMCRWGDQSWCKNATADTTWIDWMELLGYFLRPPAAYSEEMVRSYYRSAMVGYDQHLVSKSGETFKTIYEQFIRFSLQGSYKVFSYEMLLEANLKHVDVSQLRRKDPVAGVNLEYDKVPELVLASGLGQPSATGFYELRTGLLVLIPFEYKAKLERINQGVWWKDIMDLTEERWTNFKKDYRDEKMKMSLPAYQYHKWVYFKGKSSGNTAIQERDAFVTETMGLRKKLESMYQKKR